MVTYLVWILRAAPRKYHLWDAGLEKSDFLILCHRKASVPLMTEIRILVWPSWYFQCARIFLFRPATCLKMQFENSVNFRGPRGKSQSHTQQMSPYYGGHAFFEFIAAFGGIQLSTGIFDRFLHIYTTKGAKMVPSHKSENRTMLHVSGHSNYAFPIHRYFQQDFLKEKHGVNGTPKFGNVEYKHEIWPADLREESR